MAGDWVKVHRCLMDSAVWADDWLVRLWIWCLLKANHSPAVWRETPVARGQFVTGRNTASDELGVSPSKWYRGIMRLAELGNITVEANSVWTMITVCNYSTYQERETPNRTADEQRLNSERTANEQPADSERTPVRRTRTQEDTNTHAVGDSWQASITIPLGWSPELTLAAMAKWRTFRAGEDGRPPQAMQLEEMGRDAASSGWDDIRFSKAIDLGVARGSMHPIDPQDNYANKPRNGRKATEQPQPAKPAPKVGDVTGFSAPLPSPELQRQIDICEAAKAKALAEGKTPEEAREVARQLARELARAERKAIA